MYFEKGQGKFFFLFQVFFQITVMRKKRKRKKRKKKKMGEDIKYLQPFRRITHLQPFRKEKGLRVINIVL